MIGSAALGENTSIPPFLIPTVFRSKLLGGFYASGTQLHRVIERSLTFCRAVDTAVVNQAGFLQMLEGIRNRVFPSIVVQNFFPQTRRVGVQESSQNLVFKRVINGHIYLALLI
jgi:hypothetical protein